MIDLQDGGCVCCGAPIATLRATGDAPDILDTHERHLVSALIAG
jgi:hypothetical protein